MKKALIISAILTPGLASAQGNIITFVAMISRIVNLLVPIVSTLAVVFFFYGLAKYILNSGDEDKRKEGKDIMIWGILAMFVLVTIWGIIGFLQRTLGTTGGPERTNIIVPDVYPSQVI